MPWISVTTGPIAVSPDLSVLAAELASGVARVTGLSAPEVIVQVHATSAGCGVGAIVTVHGRDRGPDVESRLRSVVQTAVAAAFEVDVDLIAFARM